MPVWRKVNIAEELYSVFKAYHYSKHINYVRNTNKILPSNDILTIYKAMLSFRGLAEPGSNKGSHKPVFCTKCLTS